jgi:hypothetical protein
LKMALPLAVKAMIQGQTNPLSVWFVLDELSGSP